MWIRSHLVGNTLRGGVDYLVEVNRRNPCVGTVSLIQVDLLQHKRAGLETETLPSALGTIIKDVAAGRHHSRSARLGCRLQGTGGLKTPMVKSTKTEIYSLSERH